jgi:toxin ParE1/3/4
VAKPVRLRQVAADDIDAPLDYYRSEAGTDVAQRFVTAVTRAIVSIGRTPHSGSLRFAYELEIPDLRCRALTRFPYLVFYVEHPDHVDVWRLLHTRRDIPITLADTNEAGHRRHPSGNARSVSSAS